MPPKIKVISLDSQLFQNSSICSYRICSVICVTQTLVNKDELKFISLSPYINDNMRYSRSQMRAHLQDQWSFGLLVCIFCLFVCLFWFD